MEHSIHLLAQPHSPLQYTTPSRAQVRKQPPEIPQVSRFPMRLASPNILFPQAAYRYLGSAYRFTRNAKLKQPTFLLALFPLRRLQPVSDLGFALGPATRWALI